MLYGAGVDELAAQEREPTLLRLAAEGLPVAVPSFDDVDLLGPAKRLEILHPRASKGHAEARSVGRDAVRK